MKEKVAYFDYNSTHFPIKEIIEKSFQEYFDNFFNPSGATKFSLSCQSRIEKARSFFSEVTDKQKSGFVFTSTGTESNYLLVSALAGILNSKRIITSPFEHPSIYGALEAYEFEVIQLKTDKSGQINLNDLEEKLKYRPSPVLLLYASNETGVIQPIDEIFELTQKYKTYLFSDLSQAFGKIEIDFSSLSGFTFSGHKIGAGMGSALTFVDPKLSIGMEYSLFKGGNQENNHRAGTENLQSIIAFHKAAEFQLTSLLEKNAKLTLYQKAIETELKKLGATIVSENSARLSSTTFAILPLDDIDFFMIGMEDRNIAVSTGASCKSRTRTPSATLLSMGYTKEESLRGLRISSGLYTTDYEVELLLNGIRELFGRLK